MPESSYLVPWQIIARIDGRISRVKSPQSLSKKPDGGVAPNLKTISPPNVDKGSPGIIDFDYLVAFLENPHPTANAASQITHDTHRKTIGVNRICHTTHAACHL